MSAPNGNPGPAPHPAAAYPLPAALPAPLSAARAAKVRDCHLGRKAIV